MTEDRDPNHTRFPPWAPPGCPIIEQNVVPAGPRHLWMLRSEYPACQRLRGGGYCRICMYEVVALIAPWEREQAPPPQPEQPKPKPGSPVTAVKHEPAPQKMESFDALAEFFGS